MDLENQEWKTIEPGIWKPEQKGDRIAGVFINRVPRDEQAGISAKYYLENRTGTYLVWGSAVIEDRMQYVKPGDLVRITYLGKTKNKRNQDVNMFTVETAQKPDENTDTESEQLSVQVEEIEGTG